MSWQSSLSAHRKPCGWVCWLALSGYVLGTSLGLIAGYFGGRIDMMISAATDTMLTIPPLAILLVVAASVRTMSVENMAIIIALLSWMFPARTIRAQVLSLREQPYVHMARLAGLSDIRIIFEEIMPNILPLAAASFVGATSGAILAGIGLGSAGHGPAAHADPGHDHLLGAAIFSPD